MSDYYERVQEEIDRLRAHLEPEMLRHDIRLPRLGDVPSISELIERDTTPNDRIATTVTKVAGSVWFAYSVLSIAASWIAYNLYIVAHGGKPLDEPWAFPTMLLCSNFIQLLMPIFILVSQRRAEQRDRIREQRDQILTSIGRRDVLLMFSYLSDFASQQRLLTSHQRQSQEKLLALEREQGRISGELVPVLITLISQMSATLNVRPCIMESDPEMRRRIYLRLKETEDGPHEDDSGEGQGCQGVERVAEPE